MNNLFKMPFKTRYFQLTALYTAIFCMSVLHSTAEARTMKGHLHIEVIQNYDLNASTHDWRGTTEKMLIKIDRHAGFTTETLSVERSRKFQGALSLDGAGHLLYTTEQNEFHLGYTGQTERFAFSDEGSVILRLAAIDRARSTSAVFKDQDVMISNTECVAATESNLQCKTSIDVDAKFK